MKIKSIILTMIICVLVIIAIRSLWYYPLFKRPPILEKVSELPVFIPYVQIKATQNSLIRYQLVHNDREAVFPENNDQWSSWKKLHEIFIGDKTGYIKLFIDEKWLLFKKRSSYLFYQTDNLDNLKNQEYMTKRYINKPKVNNLKYEIVIVGDSLANGLYASSIDNTFAAIIKSEIGKNKSIKNRVAINGTSIQGYQSGGNLEEINSVLDNSADVIIIELGTNDFNKTPLLEFEKKYNDLLTTIKNKNPKAKIINLGIWRGFAGHKYDEIIYKLSNRHKSTFVYLGDIYEKKSTHGDINLNTPWGESDWFHPNDKGHQQVAERILAAIISPSSD